MAPNTFEGKFGFLMIFYFNFSNRLAPLLMSEVLFPLFFDPLEELDAPWFLGKSTDKCAGMTVITEAEDFCRVLPTRKRREKAKAVISLQVALGQVVHLLLQR